MAVPGPHGHDGLGHLLAVSSHVLHRRPTHQAGDAAQALDARQPLAHAEADESGPVLSGPGPDQGAGAVALNGYALDGHSQHRAREPGVGHDEVAAASEHQHGAAVGPGLIEDAGQRRHVAYLYEQVGRSPQAQGRPLRQAHAPGGGTGRPAARPGHGRSRAA